MRDAVPAPRRGGLLCGGVVARGVRRLCGRACRRRLEAGRTLGRIPARPPAAARRRRHPDGSGRRDRRPGAVRADGADRHAAERRFLRRAQPPGRADRSPRRADDALAAIPADEIARRGGPAHRRRGPAARGGRTARYGGAVRIRIPGGLYPCGAG